MKFLIENWVLILVAFVSGGLLVWPMMRGGGGSSTSVSTGEAVRLINREKGVLIDVGEPDEFAAGHAGGSRNVPFGQLEGSKDLPGNKTLPLLLMCPTGARAGRAAAMLRKAGYERAVAVSGGTAAWRTAQLPIDRHEKPADKADDKAAGKAVDKVAEKMAEKGAEKGSDMAAAKPAGAPEEAAGKPTPTAT